MITPCVTGLWNGAVLQAMWDLGIYACVSDNSVDNSSTVDYELPPFPYHGVYSTMERNSFEGMFFVPREALDIDYCNINDAMVVDEYNTAFLDAGEPHLNFEQIMAIQTMYAVQDKIAWRHDPFMLHQANGATFVYNDPFYGGVPRNVSLISLWMERAVKELMTYFSIPIYQPQMYELVEIFQQRMAMDSCGVTATLGVSADLTQVLGITVVSNSTCQLSISGGAVITDGLVRMESYSVETTAWINITSPILEFTFDTPVNM
jgi:hypothetical protein